MAGELAAEWIKIPDGNGNLQKVWVRDSTARRDIAQLQTDVSGKADAATTLAGYGITDAYTKTQVDGMIPSVPDPSSAAPSMDGTAAAGSSTDYARADHVHPSDTSKQDALSAAQLDELKFNDASVTCPATAIHPTLDNGSEYTDYGGVYYYKIGCRVHVNIGVSGLTSGSATTIFTLPTGYRPLHTVSNVCTAGSLTTYVRIRVFSDGTVTINANSQWADGYIDFDVF